MFYNLQEREKNILAILCVGITVAIFVFITQPQITANQENKQEIIKLESLLRKPKANKKDIEELAKALDALKKEIKVLKAQVPKTEKRGFLIRDLEELAKANKIELISFLPKEATAVAQGGQEITEKLKRILKKKKRVAVKGKVLKTVINIDSSGLFENYKKLFSDIITYYRAVDVADIIISKSGAKEVGVDKRFAAKGRGAGLLEQYKNQELNVSFTLLAYTSLEEPKE